MNTSLNMGPLTSPHHIQELLAIRAVETGLDAGCLVRPRWGQDSNLRHRFSALAGSLKI